MDYDDLTSVRITPGVVKRLGGERALGCDRVLAVYVVGAVESIAIVAFEWYCIVVDVLMWLRGLCEHSQRAIVESD
jgi:hypothetical protein